MSIHDVMFQPTDIIIIVNDGDWTLLIIRMLQICVSGIPAWSDMVDAGSDPGEAGERGHDP